MKTKRLIQIGLLLLIISALFMIGLMFVDKIKQLPEEENCEVRYNVEDIDQTVKP